jgi:hypothetical protein
MEITQELAEKVLRGGPDAIAVVRGIYQSHVEKLDALESEARKIRDAAAMLPLVWIPVSERLPEYDRTVLLTDGSDVTVAEYVEQDGWSARYVSMNWRGPIAWMPLPEPPEVK